ncbi:unnamed protein product [Cylicocyclus nassatus]|uniref:Uncharacterized protein n=1 Tax=Cylicocyclus nassatus TaxID=53992 RepID=A0AA36MDE1_CYLNA|nr:unnamed protein product [Cylicocyclus nassatus]
MVMIVLYFTLFQAVATIPQRLSFSHILRTNQYLLITQYKCQTNIETNVKDGCPRGFAHQLTPVRATPSKYCEYAVRVHLIRDPERRRPPRALYIGRNSRGSTVAFLDDLRLPQTSGLNNDSVMYSRYVDFPNTPHKHLDQQKSEFSIYDQSYQLLYLITRNSIGSQHCVVYRLSNLFPGNNDRSTFTATYVYEFSPHALNKIRSGWTEDPYSNEVFYSTTNGEMTSIHKFDLNRLLSVLQDGSSGKRVFTYTSQRNLLSVASGVLFSQHHQENHTTIFIRLIENSQRSLGLSCGFLNDKGSARNVLRSVLIVRDWDYCLVRHGVGANEDFCEKERHQWLIKEGLVSERSTALWFSAFLISVIVLVILLAILVSYICWLRRSLDDTYDGDQTTNLRCYPGQYPDMDISVDRWNY